MHHLLEVIKKFSIYNSFLKRQNTSLNSTTLHAISHKVENGQSKAIIKLYSKYAYTHTSFKIFIIYYI